MFSLSALNDEIKKKRKTLQGVANKSSANTSSGRPAKRWRALTDIEDFEHEERQRQARPDPTPSEEPKQKETPRQRSPSPTPSPPAPKEKEPPLSKPDVIRRLRALNQPATLFGEDPWDRFTRLRDLELSREEHTDGQRNFFQRKLREVAAKDAEEDAYAYAGAKLPTSGTAFSATPAAAGDATKSPADASARDGGTGEGGGGDAVNQKEDYVALQIARYMRLWRAEIDAMDKQQRRTNRGRSQLVTYEQTKHWLEPLEVLLRRRRLSKTILLALRDIFEAAASREYTKATRLYLERLAIGNAPWPMGATQVGIHSRAAREKIGEDKIAHVMNDEQTRKYIQAVKRLLTVAQRHFPTDLSKMVVS